MLIPALPEFDFDSNYKETYMRIYKGSVMRTAHPPKILYQSEDFEYKYRGWIEGPTDQCISHVFPTKDALVTGDTFTLGQIFWLMKNNALDVSGKRNIFVHKCFGVNNNITLLWTSDYRGEGWVIDLIPPECDVTSKDMIFFVLQYAENRNAA